MLILDKASFPRDKPSRDLALSGKSREALVEMGLVSRLESQVVVCVKHRGGVLLLFYFSAQA